MATHIFTFSGSDDDTWTVEFDYTLSGGYGEREAVSGLKLSPDDDEAVEVISVTDQNGDYVSPSSKEFESIVAACWKQVKGGRL